MTALDIRGRIEHLLHTWATLRSLVCDDHTITRVHLATKDTLAGIFLRIEAYCWTLEMPKHRIHTSSLHDTTILCDITKENSKTTILGISMFEITDTTILSICIKTFPLCILTSHLSREFSARSRMIDAVCLRINLSTSDIILLHLFIECLTIHALYSTINQTTLIKFVQDTQDTTGTVAFLHTILLSIRRQLTEARHLTAQLVDIFHLEVSTSFLSYSQKMEHGIGTTTHSNIKSHGIEECITGSNITWQYTLITILIISIGILHNLTSRSLEEFYAVLVGSENSTIARKTQADSLSKRVHGIGSKHTRTATATRASALLNLLHLLITHAGISTLNHSCNQVGILPLPATGFHRTSRTEYGRDIQAHRGHQHTRSYLITVRDANHSIGLVSIHHIFHRISNDIATWERIEHSVVTHSDTVVYSDGIEFGCIATHCLNFLLDNLTNFMKMSMTRNKLCKAVHDSNNWFTKLLVFHTCSYPKSSGTRHSSAFSTDATS